MKKKYMYKSILSLACLLVMGLTTACEDFLTVLPTNVITEEDFFKQKSDLDNVRSAAYHKLASSGMVGRILYNGEVRSDNVILNKVSASDIMYVREGVLQPTEAMFDWSPYYSGINYCNKVLEKGESMKAADVDPSFSEGDWKQLKAEMIGLRALYYFYLVKSYRDVPYVDKSISTDAQGRKSKIPATKGADLLGTLIEQLEANKDYAVTNYGSIENNKGRMTKRSIRTLLADMYIWRACLLAHSEEKGDSIADAETLQEQCFDKAVEHCDYVLNDMMTEYNREKEANSSATGNTDVLYSEDYPLIMYKAVSQNALDQVYSRIWAQGNSSESIFDIQYDGTNNQNTAVATYLTSFSSSGLSPAILTVNPSLIASKTNPEPAVGYGLTDFRMLETIKFDPDKPNYVYHKNIATSINIKNSENVYEGFGVEPSYRESDKTNMCQPVYRLTDVMLLKAEALARKYDGTEISAANGSNNLEIKEGFKLVNSIFARNNPKLQEGITGLSSKRLEDGYADNLGAKDLLTLVYQERQREFVGEGKRWFDLTKEAEFRNSTKDVLSMMGANSDLQIRLRQLWSMYIPIYSEELKVNDQLVQNPVWDKYSEK